MLLLQNNLLSLFFGRDTGVRRHCSIADGLNFRSMNAAVAVVSFFRCILGRTRRPESRCVWGMPKKKATWEMTDDCRMALEHSFRPSFSSSVPSSVWISVPSERPFLCGPCRFGRPPGSNKSPQSTHTHTHIRTHSVPPISSARSPVRCL